MTGTYIKMRLAGQKQFRFMTPRYGTNRLRIHAARFATPEAADAELFDLRRLNPDVEFKRITFDTEAP